MLLSSSLELGEDADNFLQMLIWEFSCLPQILKMTDKQPNGERQSALYNLSPVPTILHVCQLSRNVALKIYSLAKGDLVRRPMYYNRLRDVLLLDDFQGLRILSNQTMWVFEDGQQKSIQDSLRHIALAYDGPFGWTGTLTPQIRNKLFRTFSVLCGTISSRLRAPKYVTIVRSSSAGSETPSQVFVDYEAPNVMGSEDTTPMKVQALLRLQSMEQDDYRGYLRALAFYIKAKNEERRAAAPQLDRRANLTLSCCTLEELEDTI
jgi:hypothetical protein